VEHFHLTVGQGLFEVVVALRPPIDDSTCNGGVEDRLAVGDGTDGVHDALGSRVLQQVTAGPGRENAEKLFVLVEARENEDVGLLALLLDLPTDLDAALARHPEVEYEHVRLLGHGAFNRGVAVSSLAYDFDIAFGLNHAAQRIAHQLMIVS